MRLEEVTTVEIRPVSENQVQVIEGKAIVNLDSICMMIPATIPSDIAGPGGEPVGKPACSVFLPGGRITVKKTYQEMQALINGIKLVDEDD